MPQSPLSSDHSASLRTSCNRCRTQKLKCIVSGPPSGSVCCQRCARARVPCVFGRRERKQHAVSSESAPKVSSRPTPPVEDRDTITTVRVQCPSIVEGDIGVRKALLPHEPEEFLLHENPITSSSEHSFDHVNNFMTIQLEKELLNDVHGERVPLEDVKVFENNIFYPGHEQDPISMTDPRLVSHTTTRDWALDPNDADVLTEPPVDANSRGAFLVLLRVAANLHERLDALQNMPSWQCDHNRMENYPIGSVLQLSQRLQSIGKFLQIGKCSDLSATTDGSHQDGDAVDVDFSYLLPDRTPKHGHEPRVSHGNPPSHFSISISLILQSCYVTLLQVCVAVLGHFQDYLQAQPSARKTLSSTCSSQSSVLRLGDLSPLDKSHDQIHAAICMIISSLEQVEEALCLPPQLRHYNILEGKNDSYGYASSLSDLSFLYENENPELAFMHRDFSPCNEGIREIVLEFRRKVQETKEILRQQMDL